MSENNQEKSNEINLLIRRDRYFWFSDYSLSTNKVLGAIAYFGIYPLLFLILIESDLTGENKYIGFEFPALIIALVGYCLLWGYNKCEDKPNTDKAYKRILWLLSAVFNALLIVVIGNIIYLILNNERKDEYLIIPIVLLLIHVIIMVIGSLQNFILILKNNNEIKV
jgi:hypothetical protein